MSEYKKEIIKSTIIAILLVSLLGGISFHFFPQHPLLKAPFMLTWAKGNTAVEDTAYEHQTLDWNLLEFEFTFFNGSSIHKPEEGAISLNYHGEFNAASLQGIKILSMVNLGIIQSPENVTYNMRINKNMTIDAALRTVQLTEFGTYTCLNESRYIVAYQNSSVTISVEPGDKSYSGYWKHPTSWMIGIEQLSDLLPDSGVAWIMFNATINVDILYEITVDGETKTGETTLMYEGTIGTIEITHDQNEISWIKYDFQGVSLLLLTLSNN